MRADLDLVKPGAGLVRGNVEVRHFRGGTSQILPLAKWASHNIEGPCLVDFLSILTEDPVQSLKRLIISFSDKILAASRCTLLFPGAGRKWPERGRHRRAEG